MDLPLEDSYTKVKKEKSLTTGSPTGDGRSLQPEKLTGDAIEGKSLDHRRRADQRSRGLDNGKCAASTHMWDSWKRGHEDADRGVPVGWRVKQLVLADGVASRFPGDRRELRSFVCLAIQQWAEVIHAKYAWMNSAPKIPSIEFLSSNLEGFCGHLCVGGSAGVEPDSVSKRVMLLTMQGRLEEARKLKKEARR